MLIGSLLEAARSSDSARFETKFVVAPPQLSRLQLWVTNSALNFYANWPSRSITSVYLDTWDYSAYSNSRDGLARRAKFRIRYYGEDSAPRQAYLEAKLRHARFGYKLRHLIGDKAPFPPLDRSMGFRATSAWIRNLSKTDGLDDRLAASVLNLNPTAEIRFHRQYYHSAISPVRLTIDTSLEYRRAGNPNALFIRDPVIVCEIKAPVDLDARWSQLLASIPFRISRNSKYCRAVSSVCGPFVPRHNWERYY